MVLQNDHRLAVVDLVDAIRREPEILPLEAIASVREAGVDVEIERIADTDIVCVSPRADARLESLTPREREVAMLAASGYSNAQLATALFISVPTVKDHMHSILRKTGLDSRAQLIAAWYGGLGEAT
ncbi:MAG: LuxR C-terminal-related transcriptional regulator [Acidimicrobiia bacterium]|nr:LuxR C-terminal-related transcriptional regulator [Acidimicrobiia bacterium]